MIGDRDLDDIDVLAVEQRAMVAEGLGVRGALFGAVQMGVVKVAQRHHLDVGVP